MNLSQATVPSPSQSPTRWLTLEPARLLCRGPSPYPSAVSAREPTVAGDSPPPYLLAMPYGPCRWTTFCVPCVPGPGVARSLQARTRTRTPVQLRPRWLARSADVEMPFLVLYARRAPSRVQVGHPCPGRGPSSCMSPVPAPVPGTRVRLPGAPAEGGTDTVPPCAPRAARRPCGVPILSYDALCRPRPRPEACSVKTR